MIDELWVKTLELAQGAMFFGLAAAIYMAAGLVLVKLLRPASNSEPGRRMVRYAAVLVVCAAVSLLVLGYVMLV
ncbi:MAG TPA: hypothetical protein V6D08_11175 [Candidatus Obscuribacterales bacterium]